MFNHYYAQQERYKDFIKEAEKERIIKQIKVAEEQKKEEAAGDLGQSSLAKKLGLIFRDARPLAGKLP